MGLILKMSSVTPDFFYVFNLILSFSTCIQSFKKICVWELLGANVLKLKLRVFLAGHSVAMVTYCVTKIIPTCSTMIGQLFDTMIVASTDKEWK